MWPVKVVQFGFIKIFFVFYELVQSQLSHVIQTYFTQLTQNEMPRCCGIPDLNRLLGILLWSCCLGHSVWLSNMQIHWYSLLNQEGGKVIRRNNKVILLLKEAQRWMLNETIQESQHAVTKAFEKRGKHFHWYYARTRNILFHSKVGWKCLK